MNGGTALQLGRRALKLFENALQPGGSVLGLWLGVGSLARLVTPVLATPVLVTVQHRDGAGGNCAAPRCWCMRAGSKVAYQLRRTTNQDDSISRRAPRDRCVLRLVTDGVTKFRNFTHCRSRNTPAVYQA